MKGHIQPYLNAIISLYNNGNNSKYLTIPNVVRVQTGENVNVAISDEVQVVDENGKKMNVDGGCNSDDEFEELVAENSAAERSIDYLQEGAGVAYDFGGNGLVRGKITNCLNDDGKFVVRFMNSKSYKFPLQKARKARYVRYSWL